MTTQDLPHVPTVEEFEAMTIEEKMALGKAALCEMKQILGDACLEFLNKPDFFAGIEISGMMADYIRCFQIEQSLTEEINKEA